jgi:uncharacterized membrane protein YozB (DUF420 family)
MDFTHLAGVNATLNATSATLLAAGWFAIRRKNVARHKLCMASAFAVSVLFLISYVVYHATVGEVKFQGQGWIRPVYFTVLISHITLAAATPPLATITLYRAWKGRFAEHRTLARWTWPVWMYVSVTGVAVYVMLYKLYPAG